jgi:hypothetical protein
MFKAWAITHALQDALVTVRTHSLLLQPTQCTQCFVLQVGTLFNLRIAEAMAIKLQQPEGVEDASIETGPEIMAKAARAQSRIFSALPTEERSKILLRIADAMENDIDDILAANEKDLTAATGRIDNNMLQRLKLKPSKVKQLAEGIRQLANMEEPIGRLLSKTELAQVLFLSPKFRFSPLQLDGFEPASPTDVALRWGIEQP